MCCSVNESYSLHSCYVKAGIYGRFYGLIRLDLVWLEMGGAVRARRWDGCIGLEVTRGRLPLGPFTPGEDKGMFSKLAVAMDRRWFHTHRSRPRKANRKTIACITLAAKASADLHSDLNNT